MIEFKEKISSSIDTDKLHNNSTIKIQNSCTKIFSPDFSKDHDPLWLAVNLPNLPLEALGYSNRKTPIVVYSKSNEEKIIATNNIAKEYQIFSGMTLSSAYVLNSDLIAIPQNIKLENIFLESLVLQSRHWTPNAVVTENGFLLDFTKGTRLFGGTYLLTKEIYNWLYKIGLTFYFSLTPTSASAVLFAKAKKNTFVAKADQIHSAIRELPVELLIEDPKKQELLNQIGVYTVGELLRLPRENLSRRFDRSVTEKIDQILGKTNNPQYFLELKPFFLKEIAIENEETCIDRLHPLMLNLLKDLVIYSKSNFINAEQLEWQLSSQYGQTYSITVNTTREQLDPNYLLYLSKISFENHNFNSSINCISLNARIFSQLTCSSNSIFSRIREKYSNKEKLINKLQNRLGVQSVYGVKILNDHRPEYSWTYCIPGETGSILYFAKRPIWILKKPIPVHINNRQLTFKKKNFKIDSHHERISTGWWDDRPIKRDYYHAEANSQKIWVYRNLYNDKWYMHGIF